jgi:hypothetical protein
VTPTEKLALLQRSYAAFGAGLDIEALIPLYHPECEFRMGTTGAAFGTEVFRGHDGLRALVAAIDEASSARRTIAACSSLYCMRRSRPASSP